MNLSQETCSVRIISDTHGVWVGNSPAVALYTKQAYRAFLFILIEKLANQECDSRLAWK
ncbi:MAG TPA: hypothetical protein VN426_00375 [Syntrophomonadaceae bacterium]|nr:hypothetical protein [Syntrophomonadaceae bacterium]